MHRRALALLGLVCLLGLAGCRTWQPVEADPVALVAEDRPERVRVTRQDGVQLVLEAPEIRAGAMVATTAPGAVLLDDIRRLEVQAVSITRTVAFLLPGAILVAVIGKEVCRC